jgi:AP-3 complex subunit beta
VSGDEGPEAERKGRPLLKKRRRDQGREKQGAEIFPRGSGGSVSHRNLPVAVSVLGCCNHFLPLMAALNINAIAENASRFGARLQESLSEHTRDLNLSRGTSSEFFETTEERLKNIRHQLDSNSDREKLDAMKRLIAVRPRSSSFRVVLLNVRKMISKGRNVSEFFAQVVKNVASNNLEIRKLVYIYLLRYAEQEPDLALLSINTFQKDLTDPNPLIRAMALRVLSGVKVPMIGSIVVLAIKKCSADPSPYVRKAAALAIPKCFRCG